LTSVKGSPIISNMGGRYGKYGEIKRLARLRRSRKGSFFSLQGRRSSLERHYRKRWNPRPQALKDSSLIAAEADKDRGESQ
jgi:hypothetical protein